MATSLMEMMDTLRAPFIHKPTPVLPLRAALDKLDIVPFDNLKVTDHKRNMMRITMAEERDRFLRSGYIMAPARDVREFPLATLLPPDWYGSEIQYQYFKRDISGLRMEDIFRLGMGMYPIVFALRWKLEHVGVYDPAVPEYVRLKMRQITQIEPSVKFATDTLMSVKQVYDPFVVAGLNEEQLYFEVFGDDDHRFER